jgi:hypothetical protein
VEKNEKESQIFCGSFYFFAKFVAIWFLICGSINCYETKIGTDRSIVCGDCGNRRDALVPWRILFLSGGCVAKTV